MHQTSTDQAQLLHSSTPRHSVKNGTLIGILAAHTAENDLRTFSIFFLTENHQKITIFARSENIEFFESLCKQIVFRAQLDEILRILAKKTMKTLKCTE